MNIFKAEHEAECLKELKRQKDEHLKRLKRSRARVQKEVKNVKKDWNGGKLKAEKIKKVKKH